MRRYLLIVFVTLAGCLLVTDVCAHSINYALETVPGHDVAWYYFKLGFEHIIPDGFDHILFIAALCLLNARWKTVLWQATAFTVAHSITLALSMKDIVSLPSAIIEPIIALSIAFVAIENVLLKELKAWRVILVFVFGLVHGLGFASSLSETGLPRNQFYTSIIAFNVGVEVGQLAIIAGVFLLLILPFRYKLQFRKFLVNPVSIAIAVIALYWTVDRMIG